MYDKNIAQRMGWRNGKFIENRDATAMLPTPVQYPRFSSSFLPFRICAFLLQP